MRRREKDEAEQATAKTTAGAVAQREAEAVGGGSEEEAARSCPSALEPRIAAQEQRGH